MPKEGAFFNENILSAETILYQILPALSAAIAIHLLFNAATIVVIDFHYKPKQLKNNCACDLLSIPAECFSLKDFIPRVRSLCSTVPIEYSFYPEYSSKD